MIRHTNRKPPFGLVFLRDLVVDRLYVQKIVISRHFQNEGRIIRGIQIMVCFHLEGRFPY